MKLILKKPNNILGLFLCALLSFLIIYQISPKGFIIGTSSYWNSDAEDITQYISGFNLYLKADFQWPLLAFDSLNYPVGTRATFVDVIPIYAFILKVILPEDVKWFNPFGLWIALCFIFQGIAAWWICKELKINNWVVVLSQTVLLSLFPALLYRLGHISLMSHWIILFAIALYIRCCRKKEYCTLGWTTLLFFSFYINIYLFIMASLIYLSACLQVYFRFKIKDLKAIIFILTPCFLVFLSLFIFLLPLPTGGVASDTGFGFYSMNLLSPFIGGNIFALQSQVMPGQYEGFNYLGFGTIVFIIATFVIDKNKCIEYVKFNIYIFVICFLFFIYSLSSEIYFSQTLIAKVYYPPLLDSITTQFRASGRFFWPVGYLIIIFSSYFLYKKIKSQYFVSILFLTVTLLQLYDIKDQINLFKVRSSRPAVEQINYKDWKDFLQTNQVKNIYFYPKFRCGGDPLKTLLPVMKIASEMDLNVNTGYIARYFPECNDITKEIETSNRESSVYIFDLNSYKESDVINYLPRNETYSCEKKDFALICR